MTLSEALMKLGMEGDGKKPITRDDLYNALSEVNQ